MPGYNIYVKRLGWRVSDPMLVDGITLIISQKTKLLFNQYQHFFRAYLINTRRKHQTNGRDDL